MSVINTHSIEEECSIEVSSTGVCIHNISDAASSQEVSELLRREVMVDNFVERMVRAYVVAHYQGYKGEAGRKRTKFKTQYVP